MKMKKRVKVPLAQRFRKITWSETDKVRLHQGLHGGIFYKPPSEQEYYSLKYEIVRLKEELLKTELLLKLKEENELLKKDLLIAKLKEENELLKKEIAT